MLRDRPLVLLLVLVVVFGLGALAGAGLTDAIGQPSFGPKVPMPHHVPFAPGAASFRFAMVHDVLHERFPKHGPAFYTERDRVARVLASVGNTLNPSPSDVLRFAGTGERGGRQSYPLPPAREGRETGRGWPRSGRVRAELRSFQMPVVFNFDALDVPTRKRMEMIETARRLRRDETPAERTLWCVLRGRTLFGVKFRRQQPIGPFVVDFYAAELGLIVEVDGGIHATQQEQDAERQRIIETAGYRFLRIATESVTADLLGVRKRIGASILALRAGPN